MIKIIKKMYDNKVIKTVGSCLDPDCEGWVEFKGERVCNLDDLLKGGQAKQTIGECVECGTRYIVTQDLTEE